MSDSIKPDRAYYVDNQSSIASRKFHFGIAVTDLARSTHFYRKLLAAEPMKETGGLCTFRNR